jgi:large subunit ribosomal protein L25
MTVSCFRADIPEFIAVDLSGLTKGTSLHVKDIMLPKGVKAVAKGQVNPVMVSVTPIVEEVEVAPVVAADPKDAKGKGKGKK